MPAAKRPAKAHAAPDPDGGAGDVHELLLAAVEEAARLLEADGAMVYLVDPATGHLRFAHDAGIRSKRSRDWVRSIQLPVGMGMFGRAVADRSVVLTRDYLADDSFPHADDPDRVVRDIGIKSMVVAPLVAGDTVFGALGTFSSRLDAFSESDIRLVRALSDHAAAAMANARLIEALDASRNELAARADVERSLREIAARISAATDLSGVLQQSVEEAARLMHAEGSRIDLVDPVVGQLRGAYAAGTLEANETFAPDAGESETLDQGVAGQAVVNGTAFWTGDYLADPRFPHLRAVDEYIKSVRIVSVMAVPLVDETGPFGALLVASSRKDAWTEDDAGLLQAIAHQAAITIRTTRLIDALGQSQSALARRARAEQALREIAARITVLREPGDILRDVVTQAGRLVDADGVILDLLDPVTGNLHWAFDDGLSDLFSDEERAQLWIAVGVGATGIAVAEGRVVLAHGNLAEQFPPSPESTQFYERTGFRSMIAAPITGDRGPLGVIEVYAKEPAAFGETDASLVGALASQAAIAITNARLIEELDRSRDELSRTADAERTLREIASRVSATHDQEEILQAVIDASVRLLGAAGAMIDLIGTSAMADVWASRDSIDSPSAHLGLLSHAALTPDAGVSGRSMQTRQVEWTGAYLEDDRFAHTEERDSFVRASGIKSVIAAPLVHRDVVLGAITVYGDRPDAFDAEDAALLAALADQAAVAIANARLIEELERSRAEVARRADSEQTLREIAARVSAILEPDEVLQQIVDETTRLLESDGARIDLYDPDIDALRWAYAAGDAMARIPVWAQTGGLKPGQAVAGTAFAEQRPVRTDDYLTDERFAHDDGAQAFVLDAGIRSVISVPLAGDALPLARDATPLGTLSVVSRQVAAYDEADGEILTALATQASIAIRNARLIDELARSRAVIERRAEAEQALREIAARITAIREPGDLLQRIVDEAFRLLRADGAVIDEYDAQEDVLVSAYDAGLTDEQRASVKTSRLRLGEGLSGRAMAERRVIAAGDYLAGEFTHLETTDELARSTGIGDLIVAPIIGDEGPLGAIEVYRRERHAFDDMDAAVLGGLADQAAIAITNAHLIRELERSQAAVAKRAETERTLREITAGIAALREPEVVLDRVVEEARRLLGTDGAHLTRMGDDGTYLIPVVVAGSVDAATRGPAPLPAVPDRRRHQRPGGRAWHPIWTDDYTSDLAHPARRQRRRGRPGLGLCGMAAAPLRAPGGEVIGTLAISSADAAQLRRRGARPAPGSGRPGRHRHHQFDPVDPASSVGGGLPQPRPDLAGRHLPLRCRGSFPVHGRGRRGALRLVAGRGRGPDVRRPDRRGIAAEATANFAAQRDEHDVVRRFHYMLRHRDGTIFPARSPRSRSGGRSLRRRPGHGPRHHDRGAARTRAARVAGALPVPRRERPGRRFLDRCRRHLHVHVRGDGEDDRVGSRGGHRRSFLDGRRRVDGRDRGRSLDQARRRPAHRADLDPQAEGSGRAGSTPVEVSAIGMVDADGEFAGIHGSTRDISERDRLERELRESEERYRYLVASSPDLVWLTDAKGTLTFISDAARTMLGIEPSELMGRPYADIFAPSARRDATIALPLAGPSSDGRPPDEAAVPARRRPRRAGRDQRDRDDRRRRLHRAHGAARDVSERDRLERDLRRQAGELAAGEERAHLARELHDSVTQALFSMTLVSRSVELLLDRDPTAPSGSSSRSLRDLQREALAEMRALIFELRPGNLEQDGPVAGLRTHTAALQGRIGLPGRRREHLDERLPLPIEEVLYRISQEALHNVVKHAGARQVRLELGRIASGVRLRIVDDGKGLRPGPRPGRAPRARRDAVRAEKIGDGLRRERTRRGDRPSRSSSRMRRSPPPARPALVDGVDPRRMT